MFTQRHYIKVAATIKATADRIHDENDIERGAQLRGVRRTAAHFAEMFADDNPRFDQRRFLTACGYGAQPTLDEIDRDYRDGEWEGL